MIGEICVVSIFSIAIALGFKNIETNQEIQEPLIEKYNKFLMN